MSILNILEQQESIKKLIDNGHGELVNALLNNEQECFTKKSRLNKSGACRVLRWKTKQLEDALAACRELISESSED